MCNFLGAINRVLSNIILEIKNIRKDTLLSHLLPRMVQNNKVHQCTFSNNNMFRFYFIKKRKVYGQIIVVFYHNTCIVIKIMCT